MFCNVIIVRYQCPPVAEASQCLGRVERKGAGNPEGSSLPALEFCTQSLAAVFHDLESKIVSQNTDFVHVRNASVKLNRHDGPCAVGDRFFSGSSVDEMVGAALDENRGGAGVMYC